MTEEIVKADEGLVKIVKQFAERAVQAAESIEQLKSAPFVEAAQGLTDVITEMAVTLAKSLPQGEQNYSYRFDGLYGSIISASPECVYVIGGYFKLKIDTSDRKVKIKKYLDGSFFYSKPTAFFSRLEPEFISNQKSALLIFEEYASLPQRLSEFAKQVRKNAESRKAIVGQALQAREVPEIVIDVEDPLEERFRQLEAGGER